MDATVASLFQSLRVEEAGGLESNASYISEPGFSGRPSILSPHTDISTRPTTYDQLIDYLEMLTVPVIDPENFRLGKGIGSGASFYVQEGRLLLSGLSLCAAVKTPRRSIHKQPHVLSSIIKEVLDEIRVMSHLSMHPNVATLLGVVLEKSGAERLLPRLVVERSIGSLGSLLRKAQTGLPRDLKIRFCLEVAAGIEALHLIDIVHADVKSDNILIFLTTDNWEDSRPPMLTAKVSDFGFCVPDTTVRNRVAATGTLRFKAPESLYGSPPSLRQYANLPQRDLYSFGVLVWEIINDGDLPFSTVRDVDIPSLQLSTEDGAANFLIESSSEQPDSFTKTIRGTVVRNPVKRMAWQEVFASLTSLCDASCTSPNRYFSITEYFIEKDNRQLQVHWNEFQQVPWIPKAPIPYTTWQDRDSNDYSNLVLNELEQSSRGVTWEWISAIRLALHYFRIGNTTRMNEFLQIFSASKIPELGEYGGALLHLAVEVDAASVIPILLEKKVNVGARDNYGRTPLHMAKSIAVAQALINFGADVRARRHGTANGYTPLHVAASGEIAELLLRYGAEVDAKAYDTLLTPLHTADSADVVHVLIRYGANPLERDSDGSTPLHSTFRDDVAMSLMDLSPEALKLIDKYGCTPLHRQIDSWGVETVKHAITCGADVTATGIQGETPHFGRGSFTIFNIAGYRALFQAVTDTASIIPQKENLSVISTPLHKITEPELMDLFLRNGFSKFVNHKNRVFGHTPLHCVADRDTALFNAYIRCNAWNKPFRERHWRPGLAPPFMAASFIKYSSLVPSLQLMDMLLKHGADPNVPNSQGDSPLHLLAQNALGHKGHSEIVTLIEHLVNAGGDANARNTHGETPLHCASRVETVIALLNASTDPRLVDNESVTPLHHLYRFPESCHTVVRVLLEHGADINATDDEGFTPLHYACRLYESQSTRGLSQMRRWRSMSFSGFGQPTLQSKLKLALETTVEAVTALLDHGADVNVRTRAGETALDMLSRQPYARDAHNLLIFHGATRITEHLAPWWDFANAI